MPNVKIFVEETLFATHRAALTAALLPLRALLCADLTVEVAACQFAILPVIALPDQPPVNVEIHILPHPNRTRDRLVSVATRVQTQITAATGTPTAVRIATLTPDGYVALK